MAPLLPLYLFILSILCAVLADPVHVPLFRRAKPNRTITDVIAAANSVRARYGYASPHSRASKRAGVTNTQIIDQGQDTAYIGSIDIGTPSQTLHVILDTGSSDLWVADTQCSNCPSGSPVFKNAQSNTVVIGSGPNSRVPLTYGSGQVTGSIAQDTVSMSGFTLQNQTFVAVDNVSQGLLQGTLSGLMGLAFTSLAQTGATPFWLALADAGQTASPEMSFYLARLISDQNSPFEAPGGTFTLGGTNSSLYTGNIEFTNIIGEPSFWFLPISRLTAQGKTIAITTGSSAVAAIDTGTTLIGGPTADIKAFYDAIPGSQAVPNSGGLYAFPCDTNVTVTMSFGGTAWSINPEDMLIFQMPHSNDCVGGFFDLTAGSNVPAGSGNPSWVVGDTFLKNVYSVFRASPASVGFAQLSSQAGGTGSGTATASSSTSTGSGSGSGSPFSNYSPPSILGGKTKLVAILTSLIVAYSI